MVYEESGSSDIVLEAAEQKIYALRQGRNVGGLLPMSAVINSVFDDLSAAAASGSRIPGLSTGLPDLDRVILGLNKTQTMTKVVLPQAVKNILPALGNEFVTIIKETSLASTFFVGDLMTAYLTVKGVTYLAFESLIIVGAIYFILTFTLSKLVGAYERRLKQSD